MGKASYTAALHKTFSGTNNQNSPRNQVAENRFSKWQRIKNSQSESGKKEKVLFKSIMITLILGPQSK